MKNTLRKFAYLFNNLVVAGIVYLELFPNDSIAQFIHLSKVRLGIFIPCLVAFAVILCLCCSNVEKAIKALLMFVPVVLLLLGNYLSLLLLVKISLLTAGISILFYQLLGLFVWIDYVAGTCPISEREKRPEGLLTKVYLHQIMWMLVFVGTIVGTYLDLFSHFVFPNYASYLLLAAWFLLAFKLSYTPWPEGNASGKDPLDALTIDSLHYLESGELPLVSSIQYFLCVNASEKEGGSNENDLSL